jgi:hypothetical protein
MGMKKYFFSETWKRKVMARRRVRMMTRQSINSFTLLNLFCCRSVKWVKSMVMSLPSLDETGSGRLFEPFSSQRKGVPLE